MSSFENGSNVVEGISLETPKNLEAEARTWLYVGKSSVVRKRLGIGLTLLRELYSEKSKNFDPEFPMPFSFTKRGPLMFDLAEIDSWARRRKAAYRRDAKP